jgi:hypothetical protein
MISKVLRNFAYKPSSALNFIEGKCKLVEETKLQTSYAMYLGCTSALFLSSLSLLETNASTFLTNFLYPATPYIILTFFIRRLLNLTVKKLFLYENGKEIIIETIASPKQFYINISNIDIKRSTYNDGFTLIFTKAGFMFIIKNDSNFFNREIIEKLVLGEEIITDSDR